MTEMSPNLHVWARENVANQERPQCVWKHRSSSLKSRMTASCEILPDRAVPHKFLFTQESVRRFTLSDYWQTVSQLTLVTFILSSLVVASQQYHPEREAIARERKRKWMWEILNKRPLLLS